MFSNPGGNMKTSLIAKLEQLSDVRRAEGQRHHLSLILIITIMSIMSQIYSLRGIAAFASTHKEELIRKFKINKDRVPSYPTIRRVLSNVNFEELSEKFKSWILENELFDPNDWISLDGKSIKGTMSDYSTSQQNFISIVSAFSHKSGVVLMSKKYENKKTSEIPIVEELVKTLGLEGLTFTLDALHSKKKLLIRLSTQEIIM